MPSHAARLLLAASILAAGCSPGGGRQTGEDAPVAVGAGEVGSGRQSRAEPPRAPSVEEGLALFRRGDLPGAEAHLAGALRSAPGDRRIREALGAIYAKSDRFQKAEESFRAALSLDPASIGARLGLAAVLINTGRYEEAQEALDEVRGRDPGNAAAAVKTALLDARRGRAAEAEAGARGAISRQPGNAEAHYVLGLALMQQDRLDDAAQAMRRAHELSPGHLGALSNLVKIETRRGRREEALRWRREHDEVLSRQRVEERVRGHRLKGIEAFNRKDYAGALREFQAIAAEDPGDSQVHLHLGSTYIELGDLERARAELERSLVLDARNERAMVELGRLHALANRLDDAVEVLHRAIAANPEFAEPHYYLAGIHMARGEPDLYQQELRRFEELRRRSQGAATEVVPEAAGGLP
jgi:Flp pilus assembly protein TadD